MTNPIISVVMPLYKTEKYVADAVRSLGEQTFQDFEVVFVDDGSPDGTVSVAQREADKYGLNYKIIKQDNLGQGEARNNGVAHSVGEWIYFLDSDDVIQPFTFSVFMLVKDEYPLAQFIFSDYERVRESDIFKPQERVENASMFSGKDLSARFLLRTVVILDSGTFYKKSFISDYGITHKKLRWSEDQLFVWEVLSKCDFAVKIDCKTYNYRVREQSIMTSTPIDVILPAVDTIVDFSKNQKDVFLRTFLADRWILGTLHGFAKYADFIQFEKLLNYVNYRRVAKRLLKFPQLKIKLIALMGLFFTKKTFYKVLKRI